MIYLFHGEDELSSREAVQGLVARMKDSPVWECNVAQFDGERLDISDLIGTCQTVPFLADKRLIVVTNLLSHLGESSRGDSRRDRGGKGSGKKAVQERLLDFLPSVPDFCRLVFIEGHLLPDRDPVLRSICAADGFVKAHRLNEQGLASWIRDRCRKVGCRMSPDAADELASSVGPNSRLLSSEIVKLATYCQDRIIEAEDVRSLVEDARKANVFAMVDAVGLRQPEVSLRELRKLLSDGDHPLRVMAMLVRQFRLLMQVKELSERGASPEQIGPKVGLPFRAVTGLQRQARNFSFQQLEQAYRRLLDCDVQVKTGSREPEMALELLVVELLRAA